MLRESYVALNAIVERVLDQNKKLIDPGAISSGSATSYMCEPDNHFTPISLSSLTCKRLNSVSRHSQLENSDYKYPGNVSGCK